MSIILDDEEHKVAVRDLLEKILEELKLMNERIESAYETGIEEE